MKNKSLLRNIVFITMAIITLSAMQPKMTSANLFDGNETNNDTWFEKFWSDLFGPDGLPGKTDNINPPGNESQTGFRNEFLNQLNNDEKFRQEFINRLDTDMNFRTQFLNSIKVGERFTQNFVDKFQNDIDFRQQMLDKFDTDQNFREEILRLIDNVANFSF